MGKAVKHDEANCILRDTNGEENPRGITMFRMEICGINDPFSSNKIRDVDPQEQ
jgi:hypothetical protein